MDARTSRLYRVSQSSAQRIGLGLGGLGGAGIVLIMIATVLDVSRRALTGRSIPGVNEMAEVALVIVVFLGLMGAQTAGVQIATPIVTNRLPAPVGHAARALAAWLAAAIVLWMASETAVAGFESWQAKEFRYGLANIPIWPAKCIIPIGLLSLGFALVLQGFEHIGKFVRKEPKQAVDYQEL